MIKISQLSKNIIQSNSSMIHYHYHRFASVFMLAWVGRGLIMAPLHNLRSWASSELSFILLRSLLINWDHVFLGLLFSCLPSTTCACKHLLGYQHLSSLYSQTISVYFCVALQCCLGFPACPSIHLMICHSLSLHCTSTCTSSYQLWIF